MADGDRRTPAGGGRGRSQSRPDGRSSEKRGGDRRGGGGQGRKSTGRGGRRDWSRPADKQQVQAMVMHLLGLVQKPQIDASDALAIALCHAHTRASLIPHGLSSAKRRGGRLRL